MRKHCLIPTITVVISSKDSLFCKLLTQWSNFLYRTTTKKESCRKHKYAYGMTKNTKKMSHPEIGWQ